MAHTYNEDDHRESFLKNLKSRHSDRLVLERLKREHGPSGGFEEHKPELAPTGTPDGGPMGNVEMAPPEMDDDAGPHPEGCRCDACKAKRTRTHHHAGGDLDMGELERSMGEG